MTLRSQEVAIEGLLNLREKGNDPTAVIKQSMANGWPGLYELKNGEKTGPGYTEPSIPVLGESNKTRTRREHYGP